MDDFPTEEPDEELPPEYLKVVSPYLDDEGCVPSYFWADVAIDFFLDGQLEAAEQFRKALLHLDGYE